MNFKEIDQFKTANKKWKEKNKEFGSNILVIIYIYSLVAVLRLDSDGDMIMALM